MENIKNFYEKNRNNIHFITFLIVFLILISLVLNFSIVQENTKQDNTKNISIEKILTIINLYDMDEGNIIKLIGKPNEITIMGSESGVEKRYIYNLKNNLNLFVWMKNKKVTSWSYN